MRLVICCNHSYPHTGGSERVVQQIADSSANRFGHSVTVLSRSLSDNKSRKNVSYVPCERTEEGFINQLKKLKPDHTHVYSDCFTYWGRMLHEMDEIPGTKSIALVGMNHMRESNRVMQVFLRKHDLVNVITHSDIYLDYQKCHAKGIPVNVIPNAVNLEEFDNNDELFEKNPGKRIVLCVANFFPGKGQDHLVSILKSLRKERDDFKAWFVYSDTNFGFGKILEAKTRREADKLDVECKFYRNLPRAKVISAFKQADVFAFPSQKEVAPLVGIEAQAASTPWVSLPVGNMGDLLGGVVVASAGVDGKGYCRYSNDTYDLFASTLSGIMDYGEAYGISGRKQVEEKYSWEKVASMYNEVFEK